MRLGIGIGLTNIRASGGGGITPDYTFTNNTELQAILALGAAIEGRRIHAVGAVSTPLTIATRSYTVPPVFGVNPGASIQRLTIQDVTNVRFEGVQFQAAANWPKVNPEIVTLLGAINNVHFTGCRFRGGYGSGLANYDPSATYPEYQRVDNVVIANTTSARIALNYSDTAANVPRDAWIEFFNRGANDVRFEIGDSTVTATLASTLAPAGQRTRITWNVLNTNRPTHIAVITAAGTSEINARTEIGLAVYMSDGVGTNTPTATLNNVSFTGCTFEDLANPIKSPGTPAGVLVVDKCIFRRNYMDQLAFGGMPDTPGVELWITRNEVGQPGARSGIAENLNGDARDPHGDAVAQLYQPNAVSRSVARVYIAGNRYLPAAVRPGVVNQGIFLSMPQNPPLSFMDLIYVVGNVLPYGAQAAIAIGRAQGENTTRNAIVQGNTIVGLSDLTGSSINIAQDTTGPYHTLVKRNIARQVTIGADVVGDANALWTSGNLGATFADPNARLTATTTQGFIDAVAPVPGLAGTGYNPALIDFATTDARNSIVWANVDPGVRWRNVQDLAAATLYTSPWRRAIGGPASMSIAGAAGSEYQVATDSAGTGATAWTAATGTLLRGQWVRVRGTTSASDLTAVSFGVVIDGQTITFSATTTGPFFTSAGDFGFRDPAGSASSVNGAGGRLTVEAVLFQSTFAISTLYQHGSQITTLDTTAGGVLRLTVRDSAGTVLASNVSSAAGVIAGGVNNRIVMCLDLPGQTARTWVNGAIVHDIALGANTGLLATAGVMNLLQTNALAGRYAGRVLGLKIWKGQTTADGSAPVAAPYFDMPGVAATANASAWKSGAGVAT